MLEHCIAPRNGWSLVHEDYVDSDDLHSDWWEAHHPEHGHRILHVTGYGFNWEQRYFDWLVDNNFPSHPRGNWSVASLNKRMSEDAATA